MHASMVPVCESVYMQDVIECVNGQNMAEIQFSFHLAIKSQINYVIPSIIMFRLHWIQVHYVIKLKGYEKNKCEMEC